jgi:hypothetical protein
MKKALAAAKASPIAKLELVYCLVGAPMAAHSSFAGP